MPSDSGYKTTWGEWQTVLAALRHYKEHLSSFVQQTENEDEELVAYDHLERLDHIIPTIESRLSEEVGA